MSHPALGPSVGSVPTVVGVLAVIAISGCSTSETPTTPRDSEVPPPPAAPTAGALVAVSGNDQAGAVATVLPNPLEVRLLDTDGAPIGDEAVDWRVTAGEGTVSAARATTDASGRAYVAWTLGETMGRQTAEATFGTLPPVEFATEAKPGPIASLVVRPDSLELELAQSEALAATGADAFGNALSPSAIVWATTGATVADVSQGGMVTALGPGSALVSATVGEVSAQAMVTVLPPPPSAEAAAMSITRGSGQTGLVGTALAERIEVTVVDDGGEPIEGESVSWSVLAGGGSLPTRVSATDADGRASASWTLGGQAGTQRVGVAVAGLPSIEVSALAEAGAIASITLSPGQLQLQTSQSATLTAEAADGFGNIVSPASLSWSSDDPAVASVASNGVVTGVAAGGTTIRTSAGGVAAAASITITDTPSTPTTLEAKQGGGQTGIVGSELTDALQVRLLDEDGDPIQGEQIDWEIMSGGGLLAASVGTTDASGQASVNWTLGSAAGPQIARAVYPGLPEVTFQATAAPGPIASLALSPSNVSLEPAETASLAVSGADAFGNVVSPLSLAWSSSSPAVATVSPSGEVTAVGGGTATVQAQVAGVQATTSVTVTSPPPPPSGRTVYFTEGFENDAFAARGWYDNLGITTTSSESYSGSRSLEVHFDAGSTTPTFGGTIRHDIPETETLYLRYRVKYSSDWVGSQVGYHPHDFYLLTNRDGRWIGPSSSHLTTYVETVVQGGSIRPVVGLRDVLNIDTNNIGVDLTGVTENRAVSGCNGDTDGYATGCWNNGGGNWANEKWFTSTASIGRDGWHLVEVSFEMNSIVDGIGVPDGIVRYWLDGSLVLERTGVLFRTGANANMRYDQLLFGPYIGVGSPVGQTMWIDDLEVADRR